MMVLSLMKFHNRMPLNGELSEVVAVVLQVLVVQIVEMVAVVVLEDIELNMIPTQQEVVVQKPIQN